MLAAVLTSAASWNSEHPLLTYLVPPELEAELRVGQLVAVPYGERLVEGVIWRRESAREQDDEMEDEALRPLHSLLDPVPALLPHQMELARWLSEYYVTPLAKVVQMMLPPGLVQRSQIVLRLANAELLEGESQTELADRLLAQAGQQTLRLRALIGLLLAEGELDIERLKTMLGPTRAKEVLKEARASGLIEHDAQLQAPRAKPRVKRVVRLLLEGEELLQWQQQTEALLFEKSSLASQAAPISPAANGKGKRSTFNPWDLSAATATLVPVPLDKDGELAQHRLAAVNLLSQHAYAASHWTPSKLCKASSLTLAQLQRLEHEGVLAIEEAEVRRDPLVGRNVAVSSPLPLTPDQQHVLDVILADAALALDEDEALPAHLQRPAPILLHGVTGSGKTEIYLQALASLIEQGKRGIVLVPEIALTTQAVLRIAGRFPGRVAVIHGELGMGERYDEWRRIRAGEVDVVIGARSALFAPLPDLGIIIVDEEHEHAYKQSEMRPTYHAREAAIKLGQLLHIPVVLGSATPAIESYCRAEQQFYRLLELPGRIAASLPPVEVVDLRNELREGNTSIISRRLHEELERVLSLGQQAILYLNRRGAASCVLCRDCGFVVLCDRCDIPLTYHSTERILLCHFCGHQRQPIHFCPSCKGSGIRYFGLGTEKVQATIQRSFPQARILRWDRDTAKNRRAHEQLLDHFANREADILVGTQMIAKGLDLPGVTLVGVVSADIALNLPDYSSSERSFTLLTQVAGRAGRGAEAGRVIIQTFNPDHLCVETASHHDYHTFYAREIETRERYGYPPFRQFVKFTYSHENRQRSHNEAILLYEKLQQWISLLNLNDTDVVGPAPALTERVRNKFRWQMIARGPNLHPLLRVIDAPGWEIDIDPVSTI